MMRLLSCLYKGMDFSVSASSCLHRKQQSSKYNEGCNSTDRLPVPSYVMYLIIVFNVFDFMYNVYKLLYMYVGQHECMLQHTCCLNCNQDSSTGRHSLHRVMRCICELSNTESCLLAWQSVAYIGLGVKGAAHSPQCGHSLLYVCLQST